MLIKRRLKELGWNRQELADRVGVDKKTVDRWIKNGMCPRVVGLYLDLLLKMRELSV